MFWVFFTVLLIGLLIGFLLGVRSITESKKSENDKVINIVIGNIDRGGALYHRIKGIATVEKRKS